MIESSAPVTSDFTDYCRFFCQLRWLVASGQDESAEAETLRDDMDVLWRRLTSADLDRLDALADDLSHIGIERSYSGTVPDDLTGELRKILTGKDFDRALEFLRENEKRLPPHDVAALRGVLWAELGQHAPAAMFFADAVRLMPGNTQMRALYLRALLKSGQAETARSEALQMVTDDGDPYTLLLAADTLFDCLNWNDGTASAAELKEIIELVGRGMKCLKDDPIAEPWRSAIASSALYSKALSHEILGEMSEAVIAARQAEQLVPALADSAATKQIDWSSEGNGRLRRQLQERRRRSHDAIVPITDRWLCAA